MTHLVLGECQFMIATHVLNNVEHIVLYHNDHIVAMIHPYRQYQLVFFDEELVNILFENPAVQFPDFINYMTVDNNNVPFEGIHEIFDYCQTTLYQLQAEFDPDIEFAQVTEFDPLGMD